MTHRRWSLNSNAFGNCCITWNYTGLDIWAKYKSLKPARRIQRTGGKSGFSGRRCVSHSRDQYAVQTCGQSSAIPSLSGPGRKGNNMLEIVPHLKSCESAKVWVKEDHGEGGQLSSSIPAITAVNQHRCLTILNLKTLSINLLNSLTVNSNKMTTLSAILTAPAKTILMCLSQPVDSRLLSQWLSSISGKHMSRNCRGEIIFKIFETFPGEVEYWGYWLKFETFL